MRPMKLHLGPMKEWVSKENKDEFCSFRINAE